MLAYPVEYEAAEDGVTLWFPDIPGSVTEGDSLDDALAHAPGALVAILDGYKDQGREIPPPGDPAGRRTVLLPTLAAAKLRLYTEMRRRGVSQAELARVMGADPRQVRRLLDLTHRSWMDELDRAFTALGLRPELVVREAA